MEKEAGHWLSHSGVCTFEAALVMLLLMALSLSDYHHSLFYPPPEKVKSELIVDVARQYIEREVKKARDAKEREISNLQKIQKAWGGVGLKDCFYGWRKYARLNVNDR